MFHLVYFSSATKEFTKPELQKLLDEARKKNTKLVVSTIEADSRHKGVIVPVRGASEQRLFPDWSMGFRDLADSNIAKTPGYSDFMNTPLTGAGFTREPHRCLKLLTLFKTNM